LNKSKNKSEKVVEVKVNNINKKIQNASVEEVKIKKENAPKVKVQSKKQDVEIVFKDIKKKVEKPQKVLEVSDIKPYDGPEIAFTAEEMTKNVPGAIRQLKKISTIRTLEQAEKFAHVFDDERNKISIVLYYSYLLAFVSEYSNLVPLDVERIYFDHNVSKMTSQELQKLGARSDVGSWAFEMIGKDIWDGLDKDKVKSVVKALPMGAKILIHLLSKIHQTTKLHFSVSCVVGNIKQEDGSVKLKCIVAVCFKKAELFQQTFSSKAIKNLDQAMDFKIHCFRTFMGLYSDKIVECVVDIVRGQYNFTNVLATPPVYKFVQASVKDLDKTSAKFIWKIQGTGISRKVVVYLDAEGFLTTKPFTVPIGKVLENDSDESLYLRAKRTVSRDMVANFITKERQKNKDVLEKRVAKQNKLSNVNKFKIKKEKPIKKGKDTRQKMRSRKKNTFYQE
jgi:hypothetical protein